MGIYFIRFGLSKAQTFSVQIGMQRIDNIGRETFINEISQKIVVVVSGSFQSYFYFREVIRDRADFLIKVIKTS